MAPIREEVGLDVGATLAKVVIVAAGAALDDPGTYQTLVCPSSDVAALSAFLMQHPNASLAATGAGSGVGGGAGTGSGDGGRAASGKGGGAAGEGGAGWVEAASATIAAAAQRVL